MSQGFFVTTADRWSAKNRAEDPHTNGDFNPDDGVPSRLAAEEIAPDDLEEALHRYRFDHAVDPETMDGDTGRSAPRVDEILADSLRNELDERLARRLEEAVAGDMVLRLAGLSSLAQAIMIAKLEKQLNGEPVEPGLERANLRCKAFELAPHNTEIIGEPTGRGHS